MRKKILYVVTKNNWGGAQRYVHDLATSLPKETYEVAVALGLSAQAGGEGRLSEKLRESGVRTIAVSSFKRDMDLFADISSFFELLRIMRKESPDIVHVNSSKAGGLGALAARIEGVERIIFTSHGLVWDEDRSPLARAAVWFASWLTFLLSHAVITLSKDNFERARRLPFSKKKIHLVRNGIAPLQFIPKEEARAFLAEKSGVKLSTDGVWMGTIAELTHNKGLPYLLDAMKTLAERGRRFQFYLIGDGEDREKLARHIEMLGLSKEVHLVGFVPDAHRYLSAFDIFALPSIKEGLPYVLLEAGRAGCAVLGTRVGGVPDILADERSGLLVPAKNSFRMAEKLERLIDDEPLRQRVAENLRADVEHSFAIERMVRETTGLYS